MVSFVAKVKPLKVWLDSNNFRYCLSFFQRQYEWGEREACSLLECILDSWQRRRDLKLSEICLFYPYDQEFHWFGEEHHVQVIDGQQRLLTLLIVYNELYNNLKILGDHQAANSLYERFMYSNRFGNNDCLITSADHTESKAIKTFFADYQHDVNPSSNLLNNKRVLRHILSNALKGRDDVLSFIDFIDQQVWWTVSVTKSFEVALSSFIGINRPSARKSVQLADMIKVIFVTHSTLFGQLQPANNTKSINQFLSKWNEIFYSLQTYVSSLKNEAHCKNLMTKGSTKEDNQNRISRSFVIVILNLLGVYMEDFSELDSRHDLDEDIIKKYQTYLKDSSQFCPASFLNDYVDPSANTFKLLLTKGLPSSIGQGGLGGLASMYIDSLLSLPSFRDLIPCLVHMMKRVQGAQNPQEYLECCLQQTLAIAFFFTVCKWPRDRLCLRYVSRSIIFLAERVGNFEDFIVNHGLVSSLHFKEEFPTPRDNLLTILEIFCFKLFSIRYSSKKKKNNEVIRSILITLENIKVYHSSQGLTGGYRGQTRWEGVPTIEHISPTVPRNQLDNQQEMIILRDALGNLTILTPEEQREASNKCFQDKLDIYRKSTTLIVRELLHHKQWDAMTIKSRGIEQAENIVDWLFGNSLRFLFGQSYLNLFKAKLRTLQDHGYKKKPVRPDGVNWKQYQDNKIICCHKSTEIERFHGNLVGSTDCDIAFVLEAEDIGNKCTEIYKRHSRVTLVQLLDLAAEHGDIGVIKQVDASWPFGPHESEHILKTMYFSSCQRGNLAVFRWLIMEKKVDANSVNGSGESALLLSCRTGHENIAALLLDNTKARCDVTDCGRYSALMYACKNVMVSVVKKILERVTERHLLSANHDGNLAIHYACRSKSRNLLKYFATKAELVDVGLACEDSNQITGCDYLELNSMQDIFQTGGTLMPNQ